MKKEISILAVSDTHNLFSREDFEALPAADIFIHAGDFTMDSTPQEIQQFRQVLAVAPLLEKVVIPGNHQHIFNPDLELQQPSAEEIEEKREQMKQTCHFLQFDLVQIKGVNILGISKWPEYMDINFDFIPHLGKEIIEKYRGKVDVLVTHWPPYGILDRINRRDKGGSKGILKFVKQIKPKVHIFGHIHEGYGFTQIDGIKYYNTSYLDKHYKTKNKPFLITIPVPQEHSDNKSDQ